jgi:hypothetical protein
MVQRLRNRLARWLGARAMRLPALCVGAPPPGPGEPLVLWCDYGADPTWRFVDGGPRVSAVNLDTLALTEPTKVALRAWARTFEEITWPPDAEPASEPTEQQWDAFIREGERLRDLVAAELDPDIDVVLDHE